MATTVQEALDSNQRGARPEAVSIARIHGDWRRVNHRLAQIVHGTVYCLHVETADVVECAFSPDSGCWAEGADGRFAAVGQAISRDGEPGGEYIVAARISSRVTVPCLDLGAFDIPGTPRGCELGGGSIREVLLSAANTAGRPLQHHCTLDVCTSSRPHPDGATSLGDGSGATFCYTGRGAALNDVNGHEADEEGRYLPGTLFVHVIWTGEFETIGAKRPATRPFPFPATVVATSPILWRPLNPNLQIGSPLAAQGGCP